MGLLLVSASRLLPKGEKDRQWREVGDGPKAIEVMLLGPAWEPWFFPMPGNPGSS